MNDYYEVRIDLDPCCEDATDLLAAMLGDAGYETFVPDETGLTAYAPAALYSGQAVREILDDFPFECKTTVKAEFVPGQDWNAEWEKNYFKPIVVGGDCVIHSSFHTDVPTVRYDIVIDPKMAFGTGHHATTSLIIEKLLSLDLIGKTVIDMGTGTGILAILAAMRDAGNVYGVEIDGFAYENAVANTALNGHPEITLHHGDASVLPSLPMADVFIANINRNIITGDMDAYYKALKPGGTMLLSGFYVEDIPVVVESWEKASGSKLEGVPYFTEKDRWTCLTLVKNT